MVLGTRERLTLARTSTEGYWARVECENGADVSMNDSLEMDDRALIPLGDDDDGYLTVQTGHAAAEGDDVGTVVDLDDDDDDTGGDGNRIAPADVSEQAQLKSEDQCEMYCNTMLDRIGLGRYACSCHRHRTRHVVSNCS